MVSVGYSARQIALHWFVFILVAVQYFTGGNMTHLFRAAHGGTPSEVGSIWAPVHIAVGLAILATMLWRVRLRGTVGAPPAAKQHPALQALATAVHVGLYIDLIGAALVGLAANFWLPQLAGLHRLMVRPILTALFGLHVAGALWHWIVLRDDVMARMLRPAPDGSH
ncbi:MAG: cytochrome b/b6 domain-containing protein [Hyphomicrobiales bacterium]|nr:cytochrome b/b6 domain-containing protein [Hyphomicrobiales bacterium]MBV8439945.1 cytochrome b/b6 domain-containing protein [Hyphomicrobiales bacterium]